MLSNATLAIAIENLNGLQSKDEEQNEEDLQRKQNVYFAIILYSTFALALVRFAGVRLRLFPPLCDAHRIYSVCSTSSSVICSDVAGGTEGLSIERAAFTF
jgi:hypothetical protein